MGIFDSIRSLFNKQVAQTFTKWIYRENPLIWWDATGEIFWREGFDRNGTVYAITSKIADKVSTIPGYEYKITDQKALAKFRAMRSGYDIKSQVQSNLFLKAEFEEFKGNDHVTQLLKNPNKGQTFADFIQFVLINKMIFGGCPVVSNNGDVDMGKTLALYAYNPDMVQIKASPNLMNIEKAQVSLYGSPVPIEAKHIYFIKYQNPKIDIMGNHLFGYSPLNPGLRPLQVDNANLEAQLFIMKNKGVLGTFLPENMESLESISSGAATADELREKMRPLLKYHGEDMSDQRPYINALLKYQSFGMDAVEMGLESSHKSTKRQICQIYDYPPELLADEGTSFNNKEMAIKYLLTNTTAPHRRSIEDFVNNFLYPLNGITDRIYTLDISDMPEIQEDYQSLGDKMTATQAFSKNEIREALRWPKSDYANMDEPLVNAGLVPVSEIGDGEEMTEL
jgi:phage portal protein BeeE